MAEYKSNYTGSQIDKAIEQAHEHTNKTVLDNTTASYTEEEKNKLAGLNNYTLPTASADTLGGVKVGAGLSIENGVLSATGGTGNVSSDTINSIVVVDELPEVEEEGVLYLIKESVTPVVENLYPDQIESTQSDGFTVTFKEKNVIVDGSNSSVSVWCWTNKFNMNLEANKTYYLQFANVSGSFDDSQRIANSDGVVTNVSLSAFDSSNNETQLVSQVERTASSVYDKYVFTPTQVHNEFRVSLQVKKLNVFDNWKCLITIAEKVGE